jgi:catechol 2,3-dioxygenase-like lactoylglutathione lyase family enzyme
VRLIGGRNPKNRNILSPCRPWSTAVPGAIGLRRRPLMDDNPSARGTIYGEADSASIRLVRPAKVQLRRKLRSESISQRAPAIDTPANISLFSIELRTPQWDRMIEWYRDVLGMNVLLRDEQGGYALLEAAGMRLALMYRPATGAASERWSLSFEVDELYGVVNRLAAAHTQRNPIRLNKEGYQEMIVLDPDENRVRIFSFAEPQPAPKPGRRSKSGSKSG